MLWIGETTITLDKTYSLDEVIKEVERVKPQDVLEAARDIFKNEKLNLALIGPLEDSRQDISCRLDVS
jgi:predicted Zn-dependent peptidase